MNAAHRLVQRIVSSLRSSGFALQLRDEESELLAPIGASDAALLAQLDACEIVFLIAERLDGVGGTVVLLPGEGSDCVADYSSSLESFVGPLLD